MRISGILLVLALGGCASGGWHWVNDRGTYCYTRDSVCSAHAADTDLPEALRALGALQKIK